MPEGLALASAAGEAKAPLRRVASPPGSEGRQWWSGVRKKEEEEEVQGRQNTYTSWLTAKPLVHDHEHKLSPR